MAILNITQFQHGDVDGYPSSLIPAIGSANVTYTTTSTLSAALNANTVRVRLCTDTASYIAIGTAPTAAAATGLFLPANSPEVFTVPKGSGYKIAAITK